MSLGFKRYLKIGLEECIMYLVIYFSVIHPVILTNQWQFVFTGKYNNVLCSEMLSSAWRWSYRPKNIALLSIFEYNKLSLTDTS